MSLHRARAAFALSLALLGPHPAGAQPAAQEIAAAEALYQQGVALIEAGDLAGGCDKLAASQKLDAAVGTALRLGDCNERLGRTASAWAMFSEASSLAERDGQLARKEAADLRLAALGPQLSTVTITVATPSLPGLVVLRDGVELPSASYGAEIPLDPGSHRVEARAPGHSPWQTTILLGASGAHATVAVPELTPLPSSSPTPPAGPRGTRDGEPAPSQNAHGAGGAPDDDTSDAVALGGYVAGGVGLAGLAVGTIFGLLAKSANDESMDYCRTETLCSTDGLDLRETAKERATVSTVGFVAGGVLLGAGIVMVVVSAVTAEQPSADEAEGWSVEPIVGAGAFGGSVRARW